ncbi:MAG: DUF1648 domain-containing protein [Eubacterium sp.]
MKTKYTLFQIILEVIGAILFIGMLVFLLTKWKDIPNQVPLHFDLYGEPDRWGNKSGVLLMFFLGIGSYALFTIVSLFPKAWNIPIQITEENKEPIYRTMKTILMVEKILIVAVFFVLMLTQALAQPLSPFFVPLVVILSTANIGIGCVHIKSISKKKV